MAHAPQIHPLRQRMIEDMSMRGLAAATQRNYIRVVRACAKFARKQPDDITFDDARAFQLHLIKDGASISSINSHAIALRFFFRVTLRQTGARDLISLMTPPQRIPAVLTPGEIAAIHPPLPAPRPADGFHRIRHYGLFANAARADKVSLARRLLDALPPAPPPAAPDAAPAPKPCPCCGGRLILIEVFERGRAPQRNANHAPMRIDTS